MHILDTSHYSHQRLCMHLECKHKFYALAQKYYTQMLLIIWTKLSVRISRR